MERHWFATVAWLMLFMSSCHSAAFFMLKLLSTFLFRLMITSFLVLIVMWKRTDYLFVVSKIVSPLQIGSGTCYVDQACPELTCLSASASWVLRLKAYTTMLHSENKILCKVNTAFASLSMRDFCSLSLRIFWFCSTVKPSKVEPRHPSKIWWQCSQEDQIMTS